MKSIILWVLIILWFFIAIFAFPLNWLHDAIHKKAKEINDEN